MAEKTMITWLTFKQYVFKDRDVHIRADEIVAIIEGSDASSYIRLKNNISYHVVETHDQVRVSLARVVK